VSLGALVARSCLRQGFPYFQANRTTICPDSPRAKRVYSLTPSCHADAVALLTVHVIDRPNHDLTTPRRYARVGSRPQIAAIAWIFPVLPFRTSVDLLLSFFAPVGSWRSLAGGGVAMAPDVDLAAWALRDDSTNPFYCRERRQSVRDLNPLSGTVVEPSRALSFDTRSIRRCSARDPTRRIAAIRLVYRRN